MKKKSSALLLAAAMTLGNGIIPVQTAEDGKIADGDVTLTIYCAFPDNARSHLVIQFF